MNDTEILEFAKLLVQNVRDPAIQSSDRRLSGGVAHVIAKRWKEAAAQNNIESFAKVIIPDIVDDTIFQILRAIDQELIKLSFTATDGKMVELCADGRGELGGSYMGNDGWRSKYSRERCSDDFSDLDIND